MLINPKMTEIIENIRLKKKNRDINVDLRLYALGKRTVMNATNVSIRPQKAKINDAIASQYTWTVTGFPDRFVSVALQN